MRTLVKAAVEGVLSSIAWSAREHLLLPDRVLITAWHGVNARDRQSAGERSLHASVESFSAIVEDLVKSFDVVTLSDVLLPSKGSRPQAVLTFDDAYQSVADVALPVLRSYGVPSTIFVAPGLLGAKSVWWDDLAEATGGEIPRVIREQALTTCDGRGMFAPRFSGRIGPVPIASAGMLEKALRENEGLTLANHSMRHPNLATLSLDAAVEEIASAAEWLEGFAGERFVPWLAYPFGSTGGVAQEAAAAAGVHFAVRVCGGLTTPSAIRQDPLAIPRANIPAGLSRSGFRWRVATRVLR